MADVPLEATPRASSAGERAAARARTPQLVGMRALAPKNLAGYLLLVALTVYFLTPLYWLMVAATKDNTGLFATFGLWFANFNLAQNLGDLFTHGYGEFSHWVLNTVIYAVLGGAGGMLVAVMAGYALAKYRFRGQGLVFALVLGTALVPQTILAIPLYMVESRVNLTNTYWAVLLPSLLSPFGVLLARVLAVNAVPNELMDAARVDGAGDFRIFTRVALPLLVPSMVTIFLFQFVGIWNNFFLPLIVLSDPNYFPITVGLATWNFDPAAHEVLYNLIVTGAFISVLPLIAMFLVLQRYWRAGLALGSVTG